MHMFIESATRGGVSTINHRFGQANNKDMKSYDASQPSVYLKYLDANNLYGAAMIAPLPVGDYAWNQDAWTSEMICNLRDDAPTGYIFEVDLEYPTHLHDLHNDYPLAVESLAVQPHELSAYSQSFLDKFETVQHSSAKLIPNLRDKVKYSTHYRNLKLYLKLGLVLKRVHRVLSFRQESFMKSFIELNTKKRTEAKNDFEMDFYKLLINSNFGKMMENVRGHVTYDLVTEEETDKLLRLVAQPNYKCSNKVNDVITGVERIKSEVKLNKPIAVGFCILELSKVIMYDFHYNVMKATYGNKVKLLFTDTDSLCYKIETEDFYADMDRHRDLFDNSNLDPSHRWYDPKNKKVIGKMKDECKGMEMREFVGLRSKMYSYTIDGVSVQPAKQRKAKGVAGAVVRKDTTHSDYVECLTNNTIENVTNHAFRSQNHIIYTLLVNKIGLSAFDYKLYILDDGITTLAYGHKDIPNSNIILL